MKRLLMLGVGVLAFVGCKEAPPKKTEPAAKSQPAAAPKPATKAPDKMQMDADRARQLAKQLGGSLKKALAAGLAESPEKAISICNEKAPKIAGAVALGSGWTVGRTSLKLRNERNAPDAWEKGILERFEKELAAGKSADSLEAIEVVDGKVRYMKAIVTGGLCLSCHGPEIAPKTAEAIDRLYPKDQARGFTVGQIRGAFTLTKG